MDAPLYVRINDMHQFGETSDTLSISYLSAIPTQTLEQWNAGALDGSAPPLGRQQFGLGMDH
jgi:hypothetical protein